MSADEPPVVTSRMVAIGGALVAGMALASLWAYGQLPPDAAVPIHWNAAGDVDRYAGRLAGLFTTVAVAAAAAALLMVIPHIEPRRRNLQRSAGAYRMAYYATLGLLVVVHASVVAAALGHGVDPTRVIAAGAGVLLIVIGNWLPKVRSNFLFGVRTPWTLASDYTWRRTHRAAGRAMVVLGLLLVVSALVTGGVGAPALAIAAAVFTVGVFGYSYLVWRSAPDRDQDRRATG
ncbi:MAG TPA: SdpI family protein [Euzebyales bacterium]